MPTKDSHCEEFKGHTLADIVPAVDRSQKSQPKHLLEERHIRRALEYFEAFRKFTPDVGVTVIPHSVPPFLKYPVTCVSLFVTERGGLVKWMPCPVADALHRHYVYTITLWPCPTNVPRRVMDAQRVPDSERWVA